MDKLEHGKARAGLITGSIAHIIMHGRHKAWSTLKDQLWADDGSAFAAEVKGARAYGHEHEREGIDKFWDRHVEFDDVPGQAFIHYQGEHERFVGRLAVSVDSPIMLDGRVTAGLEIKSPMDKPTGKVDHRTRDQRLIIIKDKIENHITKPGYGPQHNPHYCQIQHGLFTTKWPSWYLVVHHGDYYWEQMFIPDRAWQTSYHERLHKFLDFYEEGRALGKVRKMRVGDL
jgi:hypothetical protein